MQYIYIYTYINIYTYSYVCTFVLKGLCNWSVKGFACAALFRAYVKFRKVCISTDFCRYSLKVPLIRKPIL